MRQEVAAWGVETLSPVQEAAAAVIMSVAAMAAAVEAPRAEVAAAAAAVLVALGVNMARQLRHRLSYE